MQISEFRDLLANDGFAATFQTMGQYRTELLRALDKLRAQADARPVAYQRRMRAYEREEWSDWHDVHEGVALDCEKTPTLNGWVYEIRRLYTHPEASAPGLSDDLRRVYEAFGIGEKARNIGVLLVNIENVKRFAEYLDAVEHEFFMVPGEPDEDHPDEEPADECLVNRWGSSKKQYVEQFRAALQRLTRASAATVAEPGASNFACYLVDHCEGETVTEEMVLHWLAAMMNSPQYAGATVAEPSKLADGEIRAIEAVPVVSVRSDREAAQQQAEPHPSQAHPTFQMVSVPNGPGTPSAQTFDRRIACKPGQPEWKSCEQQAEPGADERAAFELSEEQTDVLRNAFEQNWREEAGPCDGGYWFVRSKSKPHEYEFSEMQQDWESWLACAKYIWRKSGEPSKIRATLLQLSRACNAHGFELTDGSISQNFWYELRDEANAAIDLLDNRRAAQSGQRAGVAETAAARDVLTERQRQVSAEGWTAEHDDEHGGGEMVEAAICYAQGYKVWHPSGTHQRWPWALKWWKPTNRRRDLVKAGALILAEIERIDRRAAAPTQQQEGGKN